MDIKVYAVWFNMLPTDSKERCNTGLLDDKRTVHYWDSDREVGKWIAANVKDCTHLGPIAWDAFFLFDGSAKWDTALKPIRGCGAPIYHQRDVFRESLDEILGGENDEDPETGDLSGKSVPGKPE